MTKDDPEHVHVEPWHCRACNGYGVLAKPDSTAVDRRPDGQVIVSGVFEQCRACGGSGKRRLYRMIKNTNDRDCL